MKTNILIQYDGGGYDGNIWEWNYFYIDKDSKFHDIASSGSGGITTKLAAMLLIENNGNSFSNKVYVYALDSEEDMKTFATESNAHHVKNVIRWFDDYNDPNAEPFAICSECETKISSAYDIMGEADDIVCSDCYCSGQCECCNEYVSDGGIVEVDRDIYDNEYVCTACKEYKDAEILAEEQEELLFQSLCTGKPDIFSDEMRWRWI